MEKKCVNLDGPARRFALVGLGGKAQRAPNAAWEAGRGKLLKIASKPQPVIGSILLLSGFGPPGVAFSCSDLKRIE
jgi:hypothetical protein